MIENFLRAPTGPAEVAADLVRVLGAIGVVIAAVGWGSVAFWVSALALLGACTPRFLGVRPRLDIALGATLLVASWSSVLDLYSMIGVWDLVVHFAATGLIGAVLYTAAQRAGLVATNSPPSATALVVASLGTSAAVVWEIAEWAGHTFIDASIFVSYTDTIGDLAAGVLGAVVAGSSMRFLGERARSSAGARL